MPVYRAYFLLSGFAALVYETVWTRRLVLLFGATLSSASVVLSGFMAGLALGSLLGERAARRTRDPLALYGRLELGVAACAALLPLFLRLVSGVVEATSLPVGPVRFALVFASLLPATTLMGMTFPVLGRLGTDDDAGRSVGGLYAANLAGSGLGAMAGAYLLMPLVGLSGAHWAAVAVSLAVGLAASRGGATTQPLPEEEARPVAAAACGALFVSGLCGMAFEVVWFRLLMPSFNNSAYGFASVTTVFLAGLGGGAWLAARAPAAGVEALGVLQLLSALYAFVGYRLLEVTQLLQIAAGTMGPSGIAPVVAAPLAEAAVLLLPLAVLQGAMLPSATRLLASGRGAGPAAGRLAFWNTAGGIAGAAAAGFWLVPSVGVQSSMLAVAALAAVAGAVLCLRGARREVRWGGPALAAVLLLTLGHAARGPRLPEKILLDWLNRGVQEFRFKFYADDAEASVAVPDPLPRLIINGVGVTGYTNATKVLAHVPLGLHPKPKRVLIICFGMGGTFRSALTHGAQVEVVDLVPSVYTAFPLFHKDAAAALADPNAKTFVGDGRNHLLRSAGGWDAILVDPSPPLYAAGTVNLYSRDFYALAKRKLAPGGLLAVWLPEYPEPDYKMVLKTFVDVMPHSEFWLGTKGGGGLIMLGSSEPIPDAKGLEARLKAPRVRADLLEIDKEFEKKGSLEKLRLGSGADYADYLKGAPEVTDDFPRLEYPYFRSKTREYYDHPAILTKAVAPR